MIPILDMHAVDFRDRMIAACETSGFFAVTGHGIPLGLFTQMRSQIEQLFEATDDLKHDWMITRDNYRGFIPIGFFTPNRAEVNGEKGDRYEGFKLHWECDRDTANTIPCPLYGPNRWPPHVPELPQVVAQYWSGCDDVARALLPHFAFALGIGADELISWHDQPLTNMTLLRYPPATSSKDAGIHPHKDTNVLTFLHPGEIPGLEVRMPDGGWLRPSLPAEALLVNIGEMMELWSGGRFVATPHRAVNPKTHERFSFPWFLSPNHAVTVRPLVECVPGFRSASMQVGELSAEVWRTNWPDATPGDDSFDLGSLR